MELIRKIKTENKGEERFLSEVLRLIRSIRYGYIEIIIHNGEVVQIDKTEKIRLNGKTTKPQGGDVD